MIIGVCGRIAAGKETLTEFLVKNGFNYFETSKVIRDGLSKLGKDHTRENMQDLADEWRSQDGSGALMKRILEKINIEENWIIDSLRNFGEVGFMREKLGDKFKLIGIDAPREIRFKRIVKRGKQSDMANWNKFLKLDERDNFDPENPMGQQTGKCIENSDFIIMNDKDLKSARKQVEEIWDKLSNP